MFVGIAHFDLFLLEQPNSLKGKRSVVRRLVDRIRSRLSVSVAEVSHQDLWQRAGLGVAVVSSDQKLAEKLLDDVARLILTEGTVEIVDQQVEVSSW
ncbi:MAG: DUF503 domain-containing protein [Candidatus Eremiobacteraeota bacterium]|nr:DUF503 domain-containing protein [Candidatus Eremiobacteraeota bacterium]